MSAKKGTLLTCVHDDCGCRVRVEVECDCPDAGGPYRCTCGAEMVSVEHGGHDAAKSS
jgi:hypothetical protein